MNKHLETMKGALEGYRTAAKRARDELNRINDRLKPEAADIERERITDELSAKRRAALDAINSAQEAGISSVKDWARLDGGKITGDAKLLQDGVVSPSDFDAMVEKYKDNRTMLSYLQKYAKERNSKGGLPQYSTGQIPTQEEREKAYFYFGNAARGILSQLDGKGIMSGLDSAMLNSAIDNFGKPNATTAGLLSLLD